MDSLVTVTRCNDICQTILNVKGNGYILRAATSSKLLRHTSEKGSGLKGKNNYSLWKQIISF